jgi:two-component system sensor histidine kinase CiaH
VSGDLDVGSDAVTGATGSAHDAGDAVIARPAPAAEAADAGLLRRTRWRLIAWSAGLTLVILVVLGAAVYAAVAGWLDSRGSALLEQRAADLGRQIGRRGGLPDRPGLGFAFGGDALGTLALVVRPDGAVLGAPDDATIVGLPDAGSTTAARASGRDVRRISIDTTPLRVYSLAVRGQDGTYVVQVVGERASEEQLLGALVGVLAIGGLAALLLAIAAGYVYAGRALIPIRASMERRDAALQRQREFTANASHELRTPLTVIRASVADLRRNRGDRVEDVGSALEDIDAEVGHLTALVDDLLVVARTDSGAVDMEPVPLDLADLAAEVVGSLTPVAAASGVAIILDPRPTELSGDPLRLRQLVTILVDNAVGHSPEGATVAVVVRPGGAFASLVVEDDGPGIREDDLDRVFERFWRADDAPSGGTGLGLAIAAWIVERHGGTIRAGNRPEGGARFQVRLPAVSGAALAGEAAPALGPTGATAATDASTTAVGTDETVPPAA